MRAYKNIARRQHRNLYRPANQRAFMLGFLELAKRYASGVKNPHCADQPLTITIGKP
jgi:hypothetical protein